MYRPSLWTFKAYLKITSDYVEYNFHFNICYGQLLVSNYLIYVTKNCLLFYFNIKRVYDIWYNTKKVWNSCHQTSIHKNGTYIVTEKNQLVIVYMCIYNLETFNFEEKV